MGEEKGNSFVKAIYTFQENSKYAKHSVEFVPGVKIGLFLAFLFYYNCKMEVLTMRQSAY